MKKEIHVDPEEAISYRCAKNVTETLVLPCGEAYPICPRCHTSLEREYMGYCDRCGQALKWNRYRNSSIVRLSDLSQR